MKNLKKLKKKTKKMKTKKTNQKNDNLTACHRSKKDLVGLLRFLDNPSYFQNELDDDIFPMPPKAVISLAKKYLIDFFH